jgi:hypothetical protein
MFRSDQKHIKMNLFWFNQRFSTKRTMKKVCYFYIFSCRFTIICLKKVFLNTNFYFVYNIYISEKCMTQMYGVPDRTKILPAKYLDLFGKINLVNVRI